MVRQESQRLISENPLRRDATGQVLLTFRRHEMIKGDIYSVRSNKQMGQASEFVVNQGGGTPPLRDLFVLCTCS